MKRLPPLATADIARFWTFVDDSDEHWLWTGGKTKFGYGKFSVGRAHRNLLAHRVSWLIAYAQDPFPLQVLHRCDIAACVRPACLFRGTQKANMEDMAAKGRHPAPTPWASAAGNAMLRARPELRARGVRNGATRLTDQQVIELRRLRKDGLTLDALATRYSISRSNASLIARGVTWTHLFDPAKED